METTFLADYGCHTVKYTCLSKTDKISAFDYSASEVFSRAFSDNDRLDVVQFGKHLAELLSEACPADSGLTISLLLDVLLPPWKRELILKCCFEHLEAKRVFLGYASAAALFSTGETTGICIDVGYRGVRIVPVVNAVVKTSLCADIRSVGARSTDAVLRANFTDVNEPLLLALKSSVCFIGDGGSSSSLSSSPQHLTLPDGSTIPLMLDSTVCKKAGEALLFHAPHIHVPDILQYTYQKSLLEFPSLKQWALFGGASSISGGQELLRNSINRVVALSQETPRQLQVKAPMQAALSGGVILSQLSSFKGMCVNADEYIEEGPHRCIHIKAVDER